MISKEANDRSIKIAGITALAILLLAGSVSAAPLEEWNRTFTGAGNAAANSVQQTADGGYILAGATYNKSHYGTWLVKTDEWGNEQWNRTFNDSDNVRSVQQTADGGYIFAGRSLIKADSKGNQEWNRTYGIGTFYSVQQTSDGGYIGAGYIVEQPGYGHPDGWLIKVDGNGNEKWNRTFWGKGFGIIKYVQQTLDGGYALAGIRGTMDGGTGGAWLIKVDANGDELWSRTYGDRNRTFGDWANSVMQTKDGGYIMAGAGFLFIKTDANGNLLLIKNKKTNEKYISSSSSARQTADGGYIIAGESHTYGGYNKDGWITKMDENYDEQWNMTFGGEQEDVAFSVQQTADGGYIVAGITRHYSDGGSYVWLIKVSTEQSVSEKTPAASPTETLASNPTQALTAVQTETNTTTPPENVAGFEFVLAVIILLSVAWMRCYF